MLQPSELATGPWGGEGGGGLQFTQRSLNMTACIRQTTNFEILKLNIEVKYKVQSTYSLISCLLYECKIM